MTARLSPPAAARGVYEQPYLTLGGEVHLIAINGAGRLVGQVFVAPGASVDAAWVYLKAALEQVDPRPSLQLVG